MHWPAPTPDQAGSEPSAVFEDRGLRRRRGLVVGASAVGVAALVAIAAGSVGEPGVSGSASPGTAPHDESPTNDFTTVDSGQTTVPELTPAPAETRASTVVEAPEEPTRDPWARPFTSTSIWNMPIGSEAEYVDADLPITERHFLEHSYLLQTVEDDPEQPILRTTSWRNRCVDATEAGRTLHLPDGWTPLSVEGNRTPNNPGVFLQPDGRTLVNVGAMERCDPNGPLYAQWPQEAAHVTDLYGDGRLGAHGASNLSQLGGAIRVDELTGDDPIQHALDLLIWSEHLYWGGEKDTSFRWPASSSDSYAGPERYRGDNPELVMGSLLALPPDLEPSDLAIETAVGRKIFAALQDYGAYVTDDSAWDATYLGVDSEAIGTFEWNDETTADMADMVAALHVVANNDEGSIGGGGEPRRPLLGPLGEPPIADTVVAAQPSTLPPADSAPTSDAAGDELRAVADSAWVFDGGDWVIEDDRLTPPQQDGVASALVDTGVANVEVEVEVSLSPGRAAPGLAFRASGPDDMLVVNFVARSDLTGVFLGEVVDGEFTTIAGSQTDVMLPGRQYETRVDLEDEHVMVWVDQRLVLDETLSTETSDRLGAATMHGLRVAQWVGTDDGRSSFFHYAVSMN